MSDRTRRGFLAVTGAALGGALAGCASGTSGGASEETVAQSSFFVFGDLAEAVAGETAVAETLVPVGQHGHGWEPGPDLQATVFDSDLFIYGMEGFQPWADDIVQNIRADEIDVEPIPVGRGIDLLEHDSDQDDDHDDHDDYDDHGDHDDHDDQGDSDPHFWLDPLRMVDALEIVHEAFAEHDEANADSYEANAEAYRDRLESLHSDIADVADAVDDVTVLIAGHDAFGYLEARYGIEIEALTGLSPDATPTPRDIERAQELIAEHDITYVVADPLESQRAADQLVEETKAEEVLPLTAIPGLKQEWKDNEWGYVEIMREVNLPTLRTVLNAR